MESSYLSPKKSYLSNQVLSSSTGRLMSTKHNSPNSRNFLDARAQVYSGSSNAMQYGNASVMQYDQFRGSTNYGNSANGTPCLSTVTNSTSGLRSTGNSGNTGNGIVKPTSSISGMATGQSPTSGIPVPTHNNGLNMVTTHTNGLNMVTTHTNGLNTAPTGLNMAPAYTGGPSPRRRMPHTSGKSIYYLQFFHDGEYGKSLEKLVGLVYDDEPERLKALKMRKLQQDFETAEADNMRFEQLSMLREENLCRKLIEYEEEMELYEDDEELYYDENGTPYTRNDVDALMNELTRLERDIYRDLERDKFKREEREDCRDYVWPTGKIFVGSKQNYQNGGSSSSSGVRVKSSPNGKAKKDSNSPASKKELLNTGLKKKLSPSRSKSKITVEEDSYLKKRAEGCLGDSSDDGKEQDKDDKSADGTDEKTDASKNVNVISTAMTTSASATVVGPNGPNLEGGGQPSSKKRMSDPHPASAPIGMNLPAVPKEKPMKQKGKPCYLDTKREDDEFASHKVWNLKRLQCGREQREIYNMGNEKFLVECIGTTDGANESKSTDGKPSSIGDGANTSSDETIYHIDEITGEKWNENRVDYSMKPIGRNSGNAGLLKKKERLAAEKKALLEEAVKEMQERQKLNQSESGTDLNALTPNRMLMEKNKVSLEERLKEFSLAWMEDATKPERKIGFNGIRNPLEGNNNNAANNAVDDKVNTERRDGQTSDRNDDKAEDQSKNCDQSKPSNEQVLAKIETDFNAPLSRMISTPSGNRNGNESPKTKNLLNGLNSNSLNSMDSGSNADANDLGTQSMMCSGTLSQTSLSNAASTANLYSEYGEYDPFFDSGVRRSAREIAAETRARTGGALISNPKDTITKLTTPDLFAVGGPQRSFDRMLMRNDSDVRFGMSQTELMNTRETSSVKLLKDLRDLSRTHDALGGQCDSPTIKFKSVFTDRIASGLAKAARSATSILRNREKSKERKLAFDWQCLAEEGVEIFGKKRFDRLTAKALGSGTSSANDSVAGSGTSSLANSPCRKGSNTPCKKTSTSPNKTGASPRTGISPTSPNGKKDASPCAAAKADESKAGESQSEKADCKEERTNAICKAETKENKFSIDPGMTNPCNATAAVRPNSSALITYADIREAEAAHQCEAAHQSVAASQAGNQATTPATTQATTQAAQGAQAGEGENEEEEDLPPPELWDNLPHWTDVHDRFPELFIKEEPAVRPEVKKRETGTETGTNQALVVPKSVFGYTSGATEVVPAQSNILSMNHPASVRGIFSEAIKDCGFVRERPKKPHIEFIYTNPWNSFTVQTQYRVAMASSIQYNHGLKDQQLMDAMHDQHVENVNALENSNLEEPDFVPRTHVSTENGRVMLEIRPGVMEDITRLPPNALDGGVGTKFIHSSSPHKSVESLKQARLNRPAMRDDIIINRFSFENWDLWKSIKNGDSTEERNPDSIVQAVDNLSLNPLQKYIQPREKLACLENKRQMVVDLRQYFRKKLRHLWKELTQDEMRKRFGDEANQEEGENEGNPTKEGANPDCSDAGGIGNSESSSGAKEAIGDALSNAVTTNPSNNPSTPTAPVEKPTARETFAAKAMLARVEDSVGDHQMLNNLVSNKMSSTLNSHATKESTLVPGFIPGSSSAIASKLCGDANVVMNQALLTEDAEITEHMFEVGIPRTYLDIWQNTHERELGLRFEDRVWALAGHRPIWIHKMVHMNRGVGLELKCSILDCIKSLNANHTEDTRINANGKGEGHQHVDDENPYPSVGMSKCMNITGTAGFGAGTAGFGSTTAADLLKKDREREKGAQEREKEALPNANASKGAHYSTSHTTAGRSSMVGKDKNLLANVAALKDGLAIANKDVVAGNRDSTPTRNKNSTPTKDENCTTNPPVTSPNTGLSNRVGAATGTVVSAIPITTSSNFNTVASSSNPSSPQKASEKYASSMNSSTIVQQYIKKPHLFKGRKYGIRQWVVVTSFGSRSEIADIGMMRGYGAKDAADRKSDRKFGSNGRNRSTSKAGRNSTSRLKSPNKMSGCFDPDNEKEDKGGRSVFAANGEELVGKLRRSKGGSKKKSSKKSPTKTSIAAATKAKEPTIKYIVTAEGIKAVNLDGTPVVEEKKEEYGAEDKNTAMDENPDELQATETPHGDAETDTTGNAETDTRNGETTDTPVVDTDTPNNEDTDVESKLSKNDDFASKKSSRKGDTTSKKGDIMSRNGDSASDNQEDVESKIGDRDSKQGDDVESKNGNVDADQKTADQKTSNDDGANTIEDAKANVETSPHLPPGVVEKLFDNEIAKTEQMIRDHYPDYQFSDLSQRLKELDEASKPKSPARTPRHGGCGASKTSRGIRTPQVASRYMNTTPRGSNNSNSPNGRRPETAISPSSPNDKFCTNKVAVSSALYSRIPALKSLLEKLHELKEKKDIHTRGGYPRRLYHRDQLRAWFYGESYFKVCGGDYGKALQKHHLLQKQYAHLHFDNLARDSNIELTFEEYLDHMENEVFGKLKKKIVKKKSVVELPTEEENGNGNNGNETSNGRQTPTERQTPTSSSRRSTLDGTRKSRTPIGSNQNSLTLAEAHALGERSNRGFLSKPAEDPILGSLFGGGDGEIRSASKGSSSSSTANYGMNSTFSGGFGSAGFGGSGREISYSAMSNPAGLGSPGSFGARFGAANAFNNLLFKRGKHANMYYSAECVKEKPRQEIEYFTPKELTASWWQHIRTQMEILVSLTLESVKGYAVEESSINGYFEKNSISNSANVAGTSSQVTGHSTAVNPSGAFELLGYDFLIDCRGRVYLLEVNRGPSMSMKRAKAEKVKTQLIKNILKLVAWEKRIEDEGEHQRRASTEAPSPVKANSDIKSILSNIDTAVLKYEKANQGVGCEEEQGMQNAEKSKQENSAAQSQQENTAPESPQMKDPFPGLEKRKVVRQLTDVEHVDVANWHLLPQLTEEMLTWKSGLGKWKP